jgi:hypothetical protein
MANTKRLALQKNSHDQSSPLPLLADVGIPMISLALPLMVVLLIPLIAIKGFLCRRWLGLRRRKQ